MENYSDNELITLFREGDENAFGFLLERYKQLVSKIARSYFLVGAEYEDLIQEAMIGLYKAIKNYDTKNSASFSTFARMCIERNIQSAVKVANREKNKALNGSVSLSNQGEIKINEDEDEEISIVIPSSILSPDEKLEQSERIKQIKEQIVSLLSKFELEVLALYLKGYTYTQIALKLNMSNKRIDNALSRIKQKLAFLKKN